MRLVHGIDEQVAEWVASRIPHVGSAAELRPFVAIGIVSSAGEPAAGIVWNGYKPAYRCIELTAAAEPGVNWLTPAIVAEVFSYPFLTLNVGRVTTITPSTNRAALRLNVHLGFQCEGCVRLGYGDRDAVIMGLLRSEWIDSRWCSGGNVERFLRERPDLADPSLELH